MQNKSLMFQVCMVLFMLLVAPVKGLAQGVTISGQVTDDMDVVIGATVKVVQVIQAPLPTWMVTLN